MNKIRAIIRLLLIVVALPAWAQPTNLPTIKVSTVSVDTNGVMVAPTNFFDANAASFAKAITNVAMTVRVATLADLPALLAPSDNTLFMVQGRSAAGDWGDARQLRYVAGDASATNNGTIYTAPSGRYRMDGWDGDVRVWGVKADGVTDDTPAFNSVLAHALASTNEVETLILHSGTMIHSGVSITPTRDKLLRIRGMSANSATAVAPFGTRILLKPGSTNVLFAVQLSASHRLRLDVQGVYMDGNRDNCTNATDVLRISGDGSSYLAAGTWVDCAFNRGNRHGILLTNVVYQLKATRINAQSNRDTGIWTDRGGDHHFTSFLAEKSGSNGAYHYLTENTVYQDSDLAFSGANALVLQDCRKMRMVNCDISVAGKSCIVLAGDAANNMMHSGFVNCRIGSPNASLAGVPFSYPSGTYSTIILTGSSGTHWGHVFENCMLLAFEANDSSKPKYVFEDARSNIQWTTYPGGGITLVGCAVSTATNYAALGAFSSGFQANANLIALNDHGGAYGMANSLSGLTVQGALEGRGISTFGTSTNAVPALNAVGGLSASPIMTIDRPGNSKIGFAISGDTFRILDITNGTQIVSVSDDASTSTIYLGGQGAPRTGRIYNGNPTGADSAALPLRMFTWGTGAGSLANANFEVYSPLAGSSGSAVQSTYKTFSIQGEQLGKRTSMMLWDNESGTLRHVTTTNLTVGGFSGKFLVFE